MASPSFSASPPVRAARARLLWRSSSWRHLHCLPGLAAIGRVRLDPVLAYVERADAVAPAIPPADAEDPLVARGGGAPVARGGGAPVARGGGAPDARGGGAPVARGGGAPVARGGGAPDARGGGAPDDGAAWGPGGQVVGRALAVPTMDDLAARELALAVEGHQLGRRDPDDEPARLRRPVEQTAVALAPEQTMETVAALRFRIPVRTLDRSEERRVG